MTSRPGPEPGYLARIDQGRAVIDEIQNRALGEATASLTTTQFAALDSMPPEPTAPMVLEIIGRAMLIVCRRVAELEGRL